MYIEQVQTKSPGYVCSGGIEARKVDWFLIINVGKVFKDLLTVNKLIDLSTELFNYSDIEYCMSIFHH